MANRARRSSSSTRKTMTAEFLPGIVDSAAAVLRQHGRRAGAGARARQQQSAGQARRQHGQQGADRRIDAVDPGVRAGRAVRDRRRPRGAGRRRSRSDGDRDVAARQAAADRAQGHEAQLPARGDGDRLHLRWRPIPISPSRRPARFRRWWISWPRRGASRSIRRISSSASRATSRSRSSWTSPIIGVHVRMPKSIFKNIVNRQSLEILRRAPGARQPGAASTTARASRCASKAARCAASSPPAWSRRSKSSA